MAMRDPAGHPDVAQLTDYAVGLGGDPGLASHVSGCAPCAVEVDLLRTTIEEVRAIATRVGPPVPGCLDDHSVAALAGGDLAPLERTAALEHLGACVACRTAVASVASALASVELQGQITELTKRPRRPWVRVFVPLGAAAAIALLLLLARPTVPTVPHRSLPMPGTEPIAVSPTGVITTARALRWHAVTGADRYQVTLFGDDGSILWESASPDTVVALPGDMVLEPGRNYYWIVAARTGFDRWETSALFAFSLAGRPAR